MGRQLPPEIWTEITNYHVQNGPPPRAFLSSTEPPSTLHEYPSAYESVSAADVKWLELVSNLSRVDRQLRSMYKDVCPRDCLILTERNIHDVRARLALLPPSTASVRHLMVVLASPPCGHDDADTYAGNAKELYSDLEAIVRGLPRLAIVTLSVVNAKCSHDTCAKEEPSYFANAFHERLGLRRALEDADIQRLTFLEGAQALFPRNELSQLMLGSQHLRVASFSVHFQHIQWPLSRAYHGLNPPGPPLRRNQTAPSSSLDGQLYLALPPLPCHETAASTLQVAQRVVADTSVLTDPPLPPFFTSNNNLERITLYNASYNVATLRQTLYQIGSIREPLIEVCVICPLPALLSQPILDILPCLNAQTLSISIPSSVGKIATGAVEELPWARLEKFVKALLGFENSPGRRVREVRIVQGELAGRLRREIAERLDLVLKFREALVPVLDQEGRSLAEPVEARG